MNPVTFQLRVMQFAFIASVVLFFFISRAFPPPSQSVNASIQWVIVLCAIVSALQGFILQRMFLRVRDQTPSASESSTPRSRWFTGHVFRFATAESVALFGVVLRRVYGPSNLVTAMFVGSLLLLVLWQPGEVPAANESQSSIR
jgi:hypothetical protein